MTIFSNLVAEQAKKAEQERQRLLRTINKGDTRSRRLLYGAILCLIAALIGYLYLAGALRTAGLP